ncbi:hypothetical protein ACS5PN_03815 [Roseateles sp. NT4]|uniref:hypothetical protein n=1 Tax=Roseateles sp. NT4 TaxID=3453715 RepID=UPI003EE85E47
MNSEKLLVVAGIGLVAYMMLNRRQAGYVQYAPQGGYVQPIPNVSTTPGGQAQAQAYYGLGSMIGGIYKSVFGNIGSSAGASSVPTVNGQPTVSLLPEDGFAVNLPGLMDSYGFASAAFGSP